MKSLPYWLPWLMTMMHLHLHLTVPACQGHRILGLFPFHAKSHFIMFEKLMKGLADKGHRVDVISTFPLKRPYPNYTDLAAIPVPVQLMNNLTYSRMIELVTNQSPVHTVATLGGNDVCEYLGHPVIQKLAREPPMDPPYDLVLIEIFGAHCYAVFGHLLNVPVVGVSSSALYPWMHDMIANPENLAFVPNNLMNFVRGMNFWQRVHNTAQAIFNKCYFNYVSRKQDDLIRKHLGPGLPSVRELETNISMILVNSYISLNGIRPMTPALVEVGGLHVLDDEMELSPSLAKWLDDSVHGFVYFTFGSMVKIESFPRPILDVFYKSLAKIAPIRVLMKVPNPEELPPNLPGNVYTQPWMPQLKVLKHRNIRAFITHGGLMGTQEAVSCGVPMIGLPLFADQFINIEVYATNRMAVKLNYETLTVEQMDAALNAVLHDPIYRQSAQEVSKRFLDRPMKPVDTAVYWIEYIIKHGNDALRSPAMDLTWWQVSLIDVYAFFILVATCTVFLIAMIINLLLGSSNDSNTKHRAKKIN